MDTVAAVRACPTPLATGAQDRRSLRGLYASMVSPMGGRCQSPTRGAQELGKLIREPEPSQPKATRSPKENLSKFMKDVKKSPEKAAEVAMLASASDAPEVASARLRAERARAQRNAAAAQAARRRRELELAAAASPKLPVAACSEVAEGAGEVVGSPSTPETSAVKPSPRRRIAQKGKSPHYEAPSSPRSVDRQGKRSASLDAAATPDSEQLAAKASRRRLAF